MGNLGENPRKAELDRTVGESHFSSELWGENVFSEP